MSNDDGTNVLNPDLPFHTSSPGSQSRSRVAEDEAALRVAQPLPRPKPFNGTTAKTFKLFIHMYEIWAHSTWGPNIDDKWTPGLDSLLEGYPSILYTSYVNQTFSYEQIKECLSQVFVGETDPFSLKKTHRLNELTKGEKEPWIVFITRIQNLISELSPEMAEEDKSTRLKETLFGKMSQPMSRNVILACNIRGDWSVNTMIEILKCYDTLPKQFFDPNDESIEVEGINLGLSTNVEKRHCMYCGKTSHYMADCLEYSRSLAALSNLKLTNSTPYEQKDKTQSDRFQDGHPRGEHTHRSRDFSPYGRNYRGQSPYRYEQNQQPYGRYDNDQNKDRNHNSYRGSSPYRQDQYQRPYRYNDPNANRGRNYQGYRGQSPYRYNYYEQGRPDDRNVNRNDTRDTMPRDGGRQYDWGRGGTRPQNNATGQNKMQQEHLN